MSVVFGILKEEYDRLNSLLDEYIKDINKLPKGSICKKNIKNNFDGIIYFSYGIRSFCWIYQLR